MTKSVDSTPSGDPVEAIRNYYGRMPRMSDWFTVTQEMIDQFGRATCDSDWIHTNPERARLESPYGTPIAHGFWTLSMLTHLSRETQGADYPPGALVGINYGFERVRFPGPVPIGLRIRLHSKLIDITARDGNRYLIRTENTIEVENQSKPAVVAEWLFLLVYPAEN